MFAIDFDGTIADTNTLKSLWLLDHLGIQIPSYECDKTTCVSKIGMDQYTIMTTEVYKADYSINAEPIPGSSKAINTLRKYGLIYLITARDPEELPVVSEWLSLQKLSQNIAQLLPTNGISKISLAESLNCKVLIDDDIRHLISVSSQPLSKILLKVGLDEGIEMPPSVLLCTTWRAATEKALAFCRDH